MKLKNVKNTRGAVQVRRPRNLQQTKMSLVSRIANETRIWAERTNEKLDDPFDSNLTGMCAIAAARLFLNLQKEKIDARIVANNLHCFVTCDDIVVDVTASQFGYSDVTVIKRDIAEKIDHWKTVHVFEDVDALVKWQLDSRWPPNQIAD